MHVIRPTKITDTSLLSSNIPETEYSAWSSGTTYASGDRVIKGHRVWQSVQNSNTNHDPETELAWWADQGPTLQWAMFDDVVGTLSINPLEITVEIEPGRVNSLALFNLDAAEVHVVMEVDSSPVYDATFSMISVEGIDDWYVYFFEPIEALDTLTVSDLPVYGEGIITISMTKTAGDVTCGVMVVGLSADIGLEQYSPRLGINDYSKKIVDSFGNTTLLRKSFSKKLTTVLQIENTAVDKTYKILQELRSTPVVWVTDSPYSSMSIYGYYSNFEIEIPYPTMSFCSLTIEGLI